MSSPEPPVSGWRAVAESQWLRRLAVGGALAASSLAGLLQTVRGWRSLSADGVSYLDLGARLLQSKLTDGYSGYWSPLYAVLAAGSASLAEQAGLNRLAGVQALNFGLFVAALAACVWMVRELGISIGADPDGWPVAGLQASAAFLFTLLVFRERGLVLVTPDLLVAALVMAACALSAATWTRGWPRRHAVAAGLVFGAGYWAKAIFFPMWWWWLGLHAALGWKQRGALKALGCALAAWAALSAPLLIATTRATGRLSFGEAGKLNAAWAWNRIRPHGFWEGTEEGYGKPANPVRKVLEQPRVYVFGDQFPEATYPIWYAPSHWYEGVRVRISVPEVLSAAASSAARLVDFLGAGWGPALLFPGLLGWVFAGKRATWRPRVAVCLFAMAGFALLLVVLEPRYVFGSVMGVWAAGAAGMAAPRTGWSRTLAVCLVGMLAAAGVFAFQEAWRTARSAGPALVVSVADGVRRAGVPERSRLCWIGPVPGAGEVAWQLRGRVVAQILAADYRNWARDHGGLPGAVEAEFSKAGCQAAVAMLGDKDPPPQGWTRAGEWPVFVRLLEGRPD